MTGITGHSERGAIGAGSRLIIDCPLIVRGLIRKPAAGRYCQADVVAGTNVVRTLNRSNLNVRYRCGWRRCTDIG